MKNTEIETTLVIISNNPLEIVNQISALKSISPFNFWEKKSLNIKDIYFDTFRAKDLKKIGLALRIRKINSKDLITLKGPSKNSKRMEFEFEWSYNSLVKVISEINHRIEKNILIPKHVGKDPLQIIENLGFKAIQKRETHRIIKEVRNNDEFTIELAVDSVIYDTDPEVIHYEVELEAKTENGIKQIKELQKLLLNIYGSDLRIWDFSKIKTGELIRTLIKNPEFRNSLRLINFENRSLLNLSSDSYNIIEKSVKN
jgi:inorganic triphosphatase YgiF